MPSRTRKFEHLALLSSQMKTCLNAGLSNAKALETTGNHIRNSRLQAAFQQASQAASRGTPLSDALLPLRRHLPAFVIPFVHTGEISGKSAEAFEHLDRLCEKLVPIQRITRQLWLIPFSIISLGALARLGIVLFLGSEQAIQASVSQLLQAVGTLILLGFLLRTTVTGRTLADYLLTEIPYIGQAVRGTSFSLFFQSLNFLYKAGGQEFTTMLSLATASVPSERIRNDLEQIKTSVKSGLTLPEAMTRPKLFSEETRSFLATGAVAGRLEESLDKVTAEITESLDAQLDFAKLVLARLMGYAVVGAIIGTIQIFL